MPGEARLRVEARVNSEQVGVPRLDVRFETYDGITVVMGPSGAGKSTLLSSIAGLVRPNAGRITLGGRLLFDERTTIHLPAHERRVALVFQSLALFPHLSAWENVAYGLPRGPRDERRRRAVSWLERVRVAELAERRPETLSGGEAQRVALARALASEPEVLLLDEPFSAMDASLRRELGDELQSLVTEAAIPALLVTHDRGDADRLGARILRLEAGKLAEDSSAQSQLELDPQVGID
jgi:molybdate transport system ATP-binding protein